MGEGKLTPLTKPTLLNRQSRNITHVIMSTISPNKSHLVKIAPGVTSAHIAKVTTQFLKNFFLCTQNLSTDLLSWDTSTDAYSRRVVPIGGQKTIFSHFQPQNRQKPQFWAHIMVSLWDTYSHNCMMHRDTMLKFGTLFDLARYLKHTQKFQRTGYGRGAGG